MTTTTPTYTKEIRYDRETRDYALYLNGELVGFAANHHEGEVELNRLVFEELTRTATELDGGDEQIQAEVEAAGAWEREREEYDQFQACDSDARAESTSPSVFDPPINPDRPSSLTFSPGGSFSISQPQTILIAPDGVSELTEARCACGVELWRDELVAGVCDFCQEAIAAGRVPRRLADVSWGT
jgi:hypothetical protein